MRGMLAVLVLLMMSSCANDDEVVRDSFPEEAVTIIVPYSPGGSSDQMARLTAEGLSDYWGIEVIVDNHDGRQSGSGLLAIAEADADGYTLGMFGNPDELVHARLYDTELAMTDYDYLMGFDQMPHALLAGPGFEGEDFEDWIDIANRQPGRLTVGHSGSLGELMIFLLENETGVDVTPVRYDGGGELIQALSEDQIDTALSSCEAADDVARSGGRKLGCTGSPDGDGTTFSEQGYEILLNVMRVLVAPQGIPADHRDEIISALETVFETEAWQEAVADAEIAFVQTGPDDLMELVREMDEKIERRIEEAELSR
ncbi:tripartite tricarboxylate transporter substrate binding protein [Salisediminibacterium selenitireducens]|uniref:Tripartite tricarboxylate transporter substrate binding protein n=1 Tax=Bacillus selenitireducens (strain ATCC 700615 / DSM 15326 / MLS10) TaxID=439292 RepID=D6XXC0_BACIE|nr:tripartite tricarboxylate transporter substrate binding protein [Salisediminibacterium selenitireducens]ADH97977.1 conserved hypothetical protein [[Bacillus] selenitireducens MLS10]